MSIVWWFTDPYEAYVLGSNRDDPELFAKKPPPPPLALDS